MNDRMKQVKAGIKEAIALWSKATFFLAHQKKLFAWWIKGKPEGVLALCAEGKLKRHRRPGDTLRGILPNGSFVNRRPVWRGSCFVR